MNNDFTCNNKEPNNNGLFHKLSPNMKHSLITFALSISQEQRAEAERMLQQQREFKDRKKEMQKADRLEAATKAYAKALTYIGLFYSPFCWNTVEQAEEEFGKMGNLNEIARKDAVKEQIRICVHGFDLSDLHYKWSQRGVSKMAEELFQHFVEKIIPEQ